MAKYKNIKDSKFLKERESAEHNEIELKLFEEDKVIIDEIIKKPSRAIQLFKKTSCFKAIQNDDFDGLAFMEPFLRECYIKDEKRWSTHFNISKVTEENRENDERPQSISESVLLVDYISKKIQSSPFIRIFEFWLNSCSDEESKINYLDYLMMGWSFNPEIFWQKDLAPSLIAYLMLDQIEKYCGYSAFKIDLDRNIKIDLPDKEALYIKEKISNSYRLIIKKQTSHFYIQDSWPACLEYVDRLIRLDRDIDSLTASAIAYKVYRLLGDLQFIDKEIEINKELNDLNQKLGNPHFSFLYDAYYVKGTNDDSQAGNDAELLGLAYKEADLIDVDILGDKIKLELLNSKVLIKKDLGLYKEALIGIDELLEENTLQRYYYLKADILFALDEFKEAESIVKKIPDGDLYADDRNELLLKIYQQLDEPDKKYRILQEIEEKHGFDSVIEEYFDLVPDLAEQLESLKKKSTGSNKREIEFVEGTAKYDEDSFLELLFDYQKKHKTLNGLSDKGHRKQDIVDHDILFLYLIFIKRICDSNGKFAEKLSLPKWNVIANSDDISGSIVNIFEMLRAYFGGGKYFDLRLITKWRLTKVHDGAYASVLRQCHVEELISLMSAWEWNQKLIDDSEFYNGFKGLGYSIFNQEEYFHNHQTKPEIVELLVDLYDIESKDVVLDPACGTGRIFEKIISTMHQNNLDLPYLYGFEEDYRVASFHHLRSLLLANEKYKIDVGKMICMDKISEPADYIFFDPPMKEKTIRLFFDMVKPSLSKTGKAIVVIPSKILSTKNDMWKKLVNQNFLEAIITLPKIFDRVGIAETSNEKLDHVPSSIVILDKSRSKNSKIRLFDASNPLRKMKRGYTNDYKFIIETFKGRVRSSLFIEVLPSDIIENKYDLSISNYLNKDDLFSDIGKLIGMEDIEKKIKRKVIREYAHIMNTSVGSFNNLLKPLLNYMKANTSPRALMNPGTTYKQFEDETILERIKLVKKTQSVLINSIGTMKRLNELDENNANLEMTNIYDEIRRIHDDVGKDFVTTHNIDGVKEEDLFIQVDRRLLEQACLTQIENCVRMNKDKKDLTMKFSYRIKQSFLEVRYSNNGKPAESEIATKMFTNKYHRGDGDGNGFGQKLIQTVMSFHKEGNLIGNVKMNRNAHEEFGFTMSFPLPRNQG